MLKKIVRDILIIFSLVVLWASTSRPAMEYISKKRDGTKWWSTYPCNHGDLVSMSYLDLVKKFNEPVDTTSTGRPFFNQSGNTELYLDGDSYTWYARINASNFAGVKDLHFIHRYKGGSYHLDKAKKNILLIQITERDVRQYFSDTRLMNDFHSSQTKETSLELPVHPAHRIFAAALPDINIDYFFNKNINQNLQCNLFNYNFIIPMFETKAAMNYYLFNRASGDVVISNDRDFLFLKQTVSRTDNESSYSPVTPQEINHLVDNLNIIYDYYKADGFDEIYFSMIPNAATIVQPENYNNLIPSIQNDAHLRMKVIDVYSSFRNSKEVLYLRGDTHWNGKAIIKWLEAVNSKLRGNNNS